MKKINKTKTTCPHFKIIQSTEMMGLSTYRKTVVKVTESLAQWLVDTSDRDNLLKKDSCVKLHWAAGTACWFQSLIPTSLSSSHHLHSLLPLTFWFLTHHPYEILAKYFWQTYRILREILIWIMFYLIRFRDVTCFKFVSLFDFTDFHHETEFLLFLCFWAFQSSREHADISLQKCFHFMLKYTGELIDLRNTKLESQVVTWSSDTMKISTVDFRGSSLFTCMFFKVFFINVPVDNQC